MATSKSVVAAKDYEEFSIKKGEKHFVWKHRGEPAQRSKTPPKPSQLASSQFWRTVYNLQEEAAANPPAPELLEDEIGTVKTALEELSDNCQERLDALPENFAESSPYQGQIDALEEAISTIEGVDTDYEGEDTEEAKLAWRDEQWAEVTEALGNISCD